MDTKALTNFLLESNAAGYASGKEKQWIKQKDGSTTIEFSSGDWHSHDNFFGGEPYGGRIIVSYKSKPIWIMVYYGWVEKSANTNKIYKVLREALKQMPESAPFRGPKLLSSSEYEYKNKWTGDVENYSGEESITKDETTVYKANYMGGLVDQREGV